jgi:hypothetical protein
MGLVAYLLLTHHRPGQILRLVRTLRKGSPRAPIVIHHDFTRTALDAALLAPYAPVFLLEASPPPRWGDWRIVAAILQALGWMELNLDYRWIVLLSGQDYPLRPLRDIESSLFGSDADAFLDVETEVRDDLESPWWRRYYWNHRTLRPWLAARVSTPRARDFAMRVVARLNWRFPWIVLRFLPDGAVKLGVRPLGRTPLHGLRCYKGSAWFDLSRAAVRRLLAFVRERPDVVRHFRRTLTPDEAFFHVALLNQPSLRVRRDNRRYADWSAGGPHPKPLTLDDLPQLQASGKDFARKFDDALDAAVLDTLDQRLSAPEL